MQDKSFATLFETSKSAEEVFNAVCNVRGWWSEQIEGRTNGLNETFNYHYKDVHRCVIKIIEFKPNERIMWDVLENEFNFTKDTSEWTGTKIHFDITEKDDKTQLAFTHEGLVPAYECFDICADSWSNYITGSLKQLVDTGKGNPNPYQASVDNAADMKAGKN
ncbi:MAG: SRPBCC domain-containing protein [Ferruginibacter sp.]